MINQKLISKLASIATSILLLVLFIYFLPVILVLLGALLLLVIISAFAMKFYLNKQAVKMNFMFNNKKHQNWQQTQENLEPQEMKDVTNSSKK
jgi:uncharacterized protein YacL